MRRVSLLAIALLVAPMMSSPTSVSGQMVLGLGGGITSATAVGSDADISNIEKGSRTGLNLGATLTIPVASQFAVVPGASYVQRGVKYSDQGDEFSVNVDYITLPLLGNVILSSGSGGVAFNIFVGPTFSFEINCKEKISSGGQSASQDCAPADQDERQTFDIGALAGAGVSFPMGDRLSLAVGGGVDFGLRKLDTSADPADIKSRTIFGRVAVGIPIGG